MTPDPNTTTQAAGAAPTPTPNTATQAAGAAPTAAKTKGPPKVGDDVAIHYWGNGGPKSTTGKVVKAVKDAAGTMRLDIAFEHYGQRATLCDFAPWDGDWRKSGWSPIAPA